MVWGVFTDKHVDANCRTVNLMFFQVAVLRTGKLPYSRRFLFLNIYISQIKIITNKTYTKPDFQFAHYFGSENEVENGFKQYRNKHFSMGHAVFSGTSWQCFTMFCDIQQELVILAGTDKYLTSLKMNSIHFEGRRSLQTTKKMFDSPHYMPCLS